MENSFTLKTLGKTTWNKIKVGEVFGFDGCFEIYYKDSKNSVIFLANDVKEDNYEAYNINCASGDLNPSTIHKEEYFCFNGYGDFYKLPLEVQRLWRQDK